MATESFYWHDYETFGVDPQRDRAVQFAGLRTDFDLNIIGEPLVRYCQLAADSLPQPEACLITGITPQLAAKKGVCEAQFIEAIHQQLAQEHTCSIGYNNIRFDDEVTRHLLYRNFYDPYAREWQQGNSRWDLVDVVRAMHALRPEGVAWPRGADGKISMRLELLTAANGIEHTGAHDALADVYATIALAALIKRAQPKLFDFFLQHRHKTQVRQQLAVGTYTPVVHVSGMYGVDKSHIALVLPLCDDPSNSNAVVLYDLSVPPAPLLDLSVADIKQRLFTARADLPEGQERIALKTVHVNKCPIIAPEKVLRPSDAERLGIDRAQCLVHAEQLRHAPKLLAKLRQVFSPPDYPAQTDPDLMLYSGGFFSPQDKQIQAQIRALSAEQLAGFVFKAKDPRLEEMLFRYRGRNYAHTFNAEERQRWQAFCLARLSDDSAHGVLGFSAYQQQLQALKQQSGINQALVADLEQYAVDLQRQLSTPVA